MPPKLCMIAPETGAPSTNDSGCAASSQAIARL